MLHGVGIEPNFRLDLRGRQLGTPAALKVLNGKEIPGFGELFRWISYQSVGTSTIQSRAIGYVVRSTYIFCAAGIDGGVPRCLGSYPGASAG